MSRDARTVSGAPYPVPSSAAVTRVMKGNKKTNTKPEIALRRALWAQGLRFRKDYRIDLSDRRVRVDIVFTTAKVAVFVDGCFWHGCPDHGNQPKVNSDYWGPKLKRNVERDREIDLSLEAAGWRVVRVWEHEAVEAVARRLAELVRAHRGDMASIHDPQRP